MEFDFYKKGYILWDYQKDILRDVNNIFYELTGLNNQLVLNNDLAGVISALGMKEDKVREFLSNQEDIDYLEGVCLFECNIQVHISKLDENNLIIVVQERPIVNKDPINENMELIFNNSLVGLFFLKYKDKEFYYESTNRQYLLMTGVNENILGKTPLEILGEEYGAKKIQYLRECAEKNKIITFEEEFYFRGEKKVLLTKLKPMDIGEQRYIIGSRMEITDIKQLVEKKEEIISKFDSMFRNHIAMMLLIDPETGRIVDGNPSACKFYGYSLKELKKLNIRDINNLGKEEIGEQMHRAHKKGQKYFLFPHKLKSGEIRMVDVYSSPINVKGKSLLYSIIFDVTEREKSKEEIVYLSCHDTLTGLYNRRNFNDICKKLEKEESYPIGVLMGDVNGLKITNDVFGHECGDELLKTVSDILKEYVDKEDYIIRWGGDEFVVLMPNCSKEKIEEYLNNIYRKMNEKKINNIINISISFGYSIKNSSRFDMEMYLNEAEELMYQKKLTESRKIKNKILTTITDILHEKGIERREHINRVINICRKIGEKIKISTEEMENIKLLAEFHDIGKITLVDDGLIKDNYFIEDGEEIKSHSEAGYRIASNITDIACVAAGILNHHEYWNGSGYPRGLKNNEIPRICRIFAVSEAYDIINNKYSKVDMIRELRLESGKHFDPYIIEVLIGLIEEGVL